MLLRRRPDHPRTAQGLRAAVGYVGAGLRLRVVLCGPARDLLHDDLTPPALRRPLALLRALGHPVLPMGDPDLGDPSPGDPDPGALDPGEPLPTCLARAHAVVVW